MPKIFISYRRDDSAYVALVLAEKLAARFGTQNVFFDMDSIFIGDDFRQQIKESLDVSAVVLAVIGDHWLSDCLTSRFARRVRRLHQPDDFVRFEIQTGLERQASVIPILVGRAKMPREAELPPSLRLLSSRQAFELRPSAEFHEHVGLLLKKLGRLVDLKGELASPGTPDALPRSGQRVFMSYAAKDRDIAWRLADNLSALGEEVFLDAQAITAGQPWEEELNRLIDEADVFMLLWSGHAATSEYVRKEYHHALSAGKPIRPVYWEDPLPPVPPELAEYHFARISPPAPRESAEQI